MSRFLDEQADQVRAAAERIRPYVRRTPALRTDLSPDLRLKAECFQVTGSFKPRGAFNAVLSLMERGPRPHGVIAVSSGNHAQAVALAARTVGLPALILIPEDANPAKVAATRALGAEVMQDGITFANREQRVHDDPALDVIATPVGGGGLMSGTAIAAKSHDSKIWVVGVEPVAADDAYRSWKAGKIETLDRAPATLADGVRTTAISERTFEVMFGQGLVDEIVTVTEDEIAAAVALAWTRLHLALEPTGALPLAAFTSGKLRGGRAGLILTGGNANLKTVATLLGT